MQLSSALSKTQTYRLEVVQYIASIHVIMSRNFKQFSLFICVHLDFLGVLSSRLFELDVIINNLRYAVMEISI